MRVPGSRGHFVSSGHLHAPTHSHILIRFGLLLAIVTSAVPTGSAFFVQPAAYPTDRVLTHREQAPLVKPWIQKRFDTVLPALMTRERIDMWIIAVARIQRRPGVRDRCRRSPLLVAAAHDPRVLQPGGGQAVERYSIGRFDYDGLYTIVPTANDAQYEGLRKLVEERNPKVIGINESDAWNHADGITANEKRRLIEGARHRVRGARVQSAEMLAVGWLETKIPEELEAYRHVMKVAHMVIREAFSNKVITPGKTTSEDVVWWMRQRVAEHGPRPLVPSVDHDLAQGRRTSHVPPTRASSSAATCCTPTSASSISASPPTRSTTPTC